MHNFPKKGKCGGSDFNKRFVNGMFAHLQGTYDTILRNPVYLEKYIQNSQHTEIVKIQKILSIFFLKKVSKISLSVEG